MSEKVEKQARQLRQVVGDLVQRYRFRDRQEICCHGVSVSQCHALAALEGDGEATMGQLAGGVQLSVSTMTRVVDQLVGKELVERVASPRDRRVCCVRLTEEGKDLLGTINGGLLEMEKSILDRIAPADRENMIASLGLLVEAIDQWRSECRGECCKTNCGGKQDAGD